MTFPLTPTPYARGKRVTGNGLVPGFSLGRCTILKGRTTETSGTRMKSAQLQQSGAEQIDARGLQDFTSACASWGGAR